VNGNIPPLKPVEYSAVKAYTSGAVVRHNNAVYRSVINNNKATPGQAGWAGIDGTGTATTYNDYIQSYQYSGVHPAAAGLSVVIGDYIYSNGNVYPCKVPHVTPADILSLPTEGTYWGTYWGTPQTADAFCAENIEEWSSDATYFFGDLASVQSSGTHYIYRCAANVSRAVAPNNGSPPAANADWVCLGTEAAWSATQLVLYEIPVAVYAAGFSYKQENAGRNADMELEEGAERLRRYELDRSEGMVYWNKRLVLWGVSGNDAKNMIFCSHIEDPTWFPMPGGVDFFPEAVQYCAALGTELLVFTRSMLFLLTPDGAGGWTNQVIYSNLNIASSDYAYVAAVKNMLFFKSGKYYYLVVPRQTGGLTVAPISKPVTDMLDNWVLDPVLPHKYYDNRGRGFLQEQLEELYGLLPASTPLGQPYSDVQRREFLRVPGTGYSFFDYDSVHVRAAYTASGTYVWAVVDMVYNTITRMWSLEVFECEPGQLPRPHMADVTKRGQQIAMYHGTSPSGPNPGFQLLQYTRESKTDFAMPILSDAGTPYLTPASPMGMIDPHTNPYKVRRSVYRNYQLFDTGYRDLAAQFKRFREVTFGIVNAGRKSLTFGCDVWVDGAHVHKRCRYVTGDPVHEGGRMTIGIVPVELPEHILPGESSVSEADILTELTDEGPVYRHIYDQGFTEKDDDAGFWTLDTSAFPDSGACLMRIKIGNAKGLYPRARLVSRNESEYLLVDYTFTYRDMNARGKFGGKWAGTEHAPRRK
jgi:hypothetical protein